MVLERALVRSPGPALGKLDQLSGLLILKDQSRELRRLDLKGVEHLDKRDLVAAVLHGLCPGERAMGIKEIAQKDTQTTASGAGNSGRSSAGEVSLTAWPKPLEHGEEPREGASPGEGAHGLCRVTRGGQGRDSIVGGQGDGGQTGGDPTLWSERWSAPDPVSP